MAIMDFWSMLGAYDPPYGRHHEELARKYRSQKALCPLFGCKVALI